MRSAATFTALNRFGLGAGPGDDARVGSDPQGWLVAQVGPLPLPDLLAPFRSADSILTGINAARNSGGGEARALATQAAMQDDYRPELLARAAQFVTAEAALTERLVLFWSNHFTVSTARRQIAAAIPAYEREAIRPLVYGRFADMLRAVVRHPVMLTYLDNPFSLGPDSAEGRRRQSRGAGAVTLNENLAREVLELHTLGVDGGYAQDDVIQFALALTGWSHGGLRRGDADEGHARFLFVASQHQPGPKRVLGRLYPESGEGEALAILNDLARHPSTAQHLATKLVRHFVADAPPPEAVAQIARVFQDTDGDLAAVTRALIALPQAWADPLAKVKSHHEFLIAVHRAGGQGAPGPRHYIAPLRLLAAEPFSAPSPQGWGDTAAHWLGPESLMIRVEWARQFAGRLGTLAARTLMEDSIGAVARDVTRTWVYRAPSQDAGRAMVFASPEFQRR